MRFRYQLIWLALVVMTWTVFFQVLDFEFVDYDDGPYVFDNQHVLGGLTWENVRWSLSGAGTELMGIWHPLTWLSLMLDAQIFGSGAYGFHLTNLLFHTASVLMLFTVLRRMTGAVWNSAFVAALFAVHPLHVESVAWVSERKDVLSMFFGLVALWAYARYARRPSASWYLLALTAFVLSLLSKPMLVTLPFLLLVLDWWPLRRVRGSTSSDESTACTADAIGRDVATPEGGPSCPPRSWGRLFWEKSPFFVITAVFCLVAVLGQHKAGAVSSLEQVPLGMRASNAIVVYVIYIGMNVWPTKLSFYYPFPDSIPLLDVVGSAVLLILVTLVAIAQARQRPYLLVGWLWYLGTLVPMIGLVKAGGPGICDRFTYFPGLGLFIAVTWLAAAVVPVGFWPRRALWLFGAVLLIAYTVTAWRQASVWRNSITLFEHSLAVTEKNEQIHTNLGAVWQEKKNFDKAIYYYRKAIEIEPQHAMAHVNLGKVLSILGRFNEAIEHYQAALEVDPEHLSACNNLGNLLCEQGQYDEAVRSLREAIRIDPKFAIARCNLGFALIGQGKFDEAQRHFQEAARINPAFAVTDEELASRHVKVGETLTARGMLRHAITQFREALRRMPGHTGAQYDLAQALATLGQLDEARELYTQVLSTHPDFAEAHNELGELLLLQGERELAVNHFREALRVKPKLDVARKNLKRALAE